MFSRKLPRDLWLDPDGPAHKKVAANLLILQGVKQHSPFPIVAEPDQFLL